MDRLPNGLIDLTGQTFGRLTVLARGRNYVSPIGKHRPRWRCLCECGGEALVQRDHLVTGHTRSCGCLLAEALRLLREMARYGCVIEGCERKHHAHGWCNSHYRRWTIYGDPLSPPSRRRT